MISFNGAAPVKERKTRATRWSRPSRSRSFNGAAPVKERKTRPAELVENPATGFNGAAPVKERKTSTESVELAASIEASMGPLR